MATISEQHIDWARPVHRRRRAWGEGLIEQGWTAFYQSATWKSVGEDEYAVLVPSLVADADGAGRDALEQQLRLALVARLHEAVRILSPTFGGADGARAAIESSTALAHLPPVERWPLDKVAWQSFYDRPVRPWTTIRGWWNAPQATPPDQRLRFEFDIITALDRALGAARSLPAATAAATIEDVVLMSLYSGCNGAYVYREWVDRHEMLTLAAWLGYLVRGHRAILSPAIASLIVAYLGVESAYCSHRAIHSNVMIRLLAEPSNGYCALMRQARKVLRTDRAVMTALSPLIL